MGWPSITDRELLERLALDDAGFEAYMRALFEAVPAGRACDAAVVDYAFAYPWERPASSYVLEPEGITEFDRLDARERATHIAAFTTPAAGRVPLIAIGSNAAPERLRMKFAHFDDPDDRTALVVTGALHDFDVGVAAHPTGYGSLPATVFPSPGTAVRVAVQWLTPAQFTQLTWSEISYFLGRLHARFEADEPGLNLDAALLFVSRLGAFAPDGEPVALAAVPADGRTAPALTQRELLGRAAQLVHGPGATAEELVQAVFADWAAVARAAGELRRANAPFASERWERFGG